MKSIKVGVAGTGLAAIVALTLSWAGASASSSAALIGLTPQATAVENAMTETNLPGKLQVALGDSYGGIWFEPSTAQLHVGVTSPAAKRVAEMLAAEAGMSADLAITRVASSWVELEAAQNHWDAKLTDLITGGDASTALSPDHNAVEIDLGSTVPTNRRAALEHDAEAAAVDVRVLTMPYDDLGVTAQARCNEFAVGEAFCNPGLVGGVTFVAENGTSCTAGPAVISKKAAEATKTFVLTAGHCVEDGGGANEKWYAYNQEGKPAGKREVGKAITFLNGETDVGLVEVNTTYWSSAGLIPLIPTIAPWDQKAPEPFLVVAPKVPVLNTKACMAGQKSAIVCGKIIKTDQTIEVEGVETKNLVEVEAPESINGDSGAPWFSESEFKEATPRGYVEGTHVGDKGATSHPVFQPLSVSLPALKNEKGWELELLTVATAFRDVVKWFHSQIQRIFLLGSQSTANVFTTAAGNVKCKSATFAGEFVGTEKSASDFTTSSITLTPSYSECTAFGQTATVSTTGCAYKLSPENVLIEISGCLVGGYGGIVISVPTGNCTVKVPNQVPGTKAVDYTNEGTGTSRDVLIRSTVSGISYEVVGPGAICGTVGSHSDGVYTGTITEKGYKDAAHTEQTGFWVE